MGRYDRELVRLYHRLPVSARSVVASARGYQLRRWRYGPETDQLVAEATAREHWTAAQWSAYQEEQLGRLLHRAATRVPFYRDHWAERRRRGDRRSAEQLDHWPLVEKDTVRANPRVFLADDCDPRSMFSDHTSGTSGRSLDVWFQRHAVRAWYALYEARCRSWYGVSRRDRWAIVGAQLVVPSTQRRPPFWVWNAGLNQLYMSSWHLSATNISSYLEALKRHRIIFLTGFATSLDSLARYVLQVYGGPVGLPIKVAIAHAEPLLADQRRNIAAAFACPVRETYGMAEVVTAASDCGNLGLHLWPDVGVVEVLEGDQSVAPGSSGELVCTGFLNPDMPLIRYRVGDRGAVAAEMTACVCRRTLPKLLALDGRSDDMLFTRDGRRIGQLESTFRLNLPIREAQLIQDSLDAIRVRFVPSPAYDERAGRLMKERVRDRLGDVEVVLEEVGEIPRLANGKFRYVVCNLSPEERELAVGS